MTTNNLGTLLMLALALSCPFALAGEPEWSADINKAKFFEHTGNFREAETALQDSIEKAKDVVDRRAVVFSNLELGDLYMAWNQQSRAPSFYQQAFDAAKNIDKSIEQYAVTRAIETCTKLNDTQQVSKLREKYKKVLALQLSPPDMTEYMPDMSLMLRKHWFPTKRNNNGETTVTFMMSREGKPSLLHLETSSGDEDADARAITAVANAAPFAALPAGAPPSGLVMHYTFKYTPTAEAKEAPLIEEVPNSSLWRQKTTGTQQPFMQEVPSRPFRRRRLNNH